MKRAWHPDELARYWTLAPDEQRLLGSNTASSTRLSTAVLLKSFQLDGRFPERRADVAGSVVVHLANQIGVPPEVYFDGEWPTGSIRANFYGKDSVFVRLTVKIRTETANSL
jgi:Domain of unknown function (DUF4158)